MTNNTPIVITRDTVSRPWAELDPKVGMALIVGFLALIAVIVSKSLGISLPPEVGSVIPFAFAILAGYFTKGTGTTITQYASNGQKVSSETHHGPTVTTVSTPIQAPAATTSAPSEFTQTIDPAPTPDEKPTEVLQPASPGAAFFAARAGSNDGGH